MSSELKQLLLAAPDTQLDAQMLPLIEKWDEPNPTSLQILEVLDQCIFASLASGFVVSLLQTLYDAALKNEGRTHEQNEPLATWRQG
jgi:hypothetical protein